MMAAAAGTASTPVINSASAPVHISLRTPYTYQDAGGERENFRPPPAPWAYGLVVDSVKVSVVL